MLKEREYWKKKKNGKWNDNKRANKVANLTHKKSVSYVQNILLVRNSDRMKNLHSFVAQKCGKNLLLIKYRRRSLGRRTNDSGGISEPHVKRANFISLPFPHVSLLKDLRARRERERKIVRHVSYTYTQRAPTKTIATASCWGNSEKKKISFEFSLLRNVGVCRSVAGAAAVLSRLCRFLKINII